MDSIATTDNYTGAMQVRGRVFLSPPNGTTAYLHRWDSAARTWYTIEAVRAAGGTFTVGVHRPASVTAYRIVVPARSPYGTGVSATRWFANYVWRGAFVRPVVSSNPPGHYSLPDNDPRRDRITVARPDRDDDHRDQRERLPADHHLDDVVAVGLPPDPAQPAHRPGPCRGHTRTRRTSTMTADLAPSETVVGFQHVNPDPIMPIDSTVSVLCSN